MNIKIWSVFFNQNTGQMGSRYITHCRACSAADRATIGYKLILFQPPKPPTRLFNPCLWGLYQFLQSHPPATTTALITDAKRLRTAVTGSERSAERRGALLQDGAHEAHQPRRVVLGDQRRMRLVARLPRGGLGAGGTVQVRVRPGVGGLGGESICPRFGGFYDWSSAKASKMCLVLMTFQGVLFILSPISGALHWRSATSTETPLLRSPSVCRA